MTKSSEWYDKDFVKNAGSYSKGSYQRRNLMMSNMIKNYLPKRVFEFAGAEGQLAQFILNQNPQIEHYLWSDFSKEAVKEASNKLAKFKNCKIELLDMNNDLEKIPWKEFDCIVSTSLEHIDKDIEIMEKIEPKTLICLALPNFPSPGHVRHFPTSKTIFERYGKYLEFLEFEEDESCFILKDYMLSFRFIMVIKHLLYRLNLLKYVQKIILKSKYPSGRYLIVAKKRCS